MAFDYSASFAGINNAIASLGKQNERAYQRQTLANLGQQIQGGDYNAAAQAAFAAGDAGTGLGLLKLGQTQKQEADWLAANGGILGGGAAPTAPAAPAGNIPLVTSGDRSRPRGIRNNNPGNIEAGGFTAGQAGFKGSDGRFAVFETPEQGIQAADRLLQSYAGRGLNTVAGIVNRWAPPSENNTGAYVASVARDLGVDPNAPLDMSSPQVRQALISAKIKVENGQNPYGADVFARAYGGGQPAPVQVAENEADVQRLEAAQADAPNRPAPGAANAQGFAIPGGGDVPQSIANDPRVMNLQRALAGAPDRFKPSIQSRLNILVEELKTQQSQNAPTDAVRNYRFYRQEEQAAGREPMSFQSFRESTANRTNVNMPPAEKEYDKQSAKDFAELNRDVAKRAAGANSKIATLNRLETLLTDPNVKTGAGAQFALQAARIAKGAFGIDTEGLGPAEAINAISNQFALELRNPSGGAGMPGALSDKDREFLQSVTPGLDRTPEGNKLIIDYMRRLSKRDIEIEGLRRDYIKQNKRLDDGFYEKLAEFSEKNPLFPEAPAAPKGPISIKTADDYGKLKSGDQYMDPDGNLRTKR